MNIAMSSTGNTRRFVPPEGQTMRASNHFSAHAVDPFSSPRSFFSSLAQALLATAFFRCWHLLLFFTGWATAISLIINNVRDLSIQPTLLTVIGTVLGFVISYRTTSSFERYNEGRKYWSQIILSSRTLARAIWFHIPELPPPINSEDTRSDEERRARMLIEKKTSINLIEAFAVAVKHYLRGEEGIHYVDLYHLVKFLPSYALPAGFPQSAVNPNASKTSLSLRHSHARSTFEHDDHENHMGHHREYSNGNGNGTLSPVMEGSETKSLSSSKTDVSKKGGLIYTSGNVTAVTSASNLPLPPSPTTPRSYTSVKRPENPTAQSPIPYPAAETLAQRRGVSYAPELPAPATSAKRSPSFFSLRAPASRGHGSVGQSASHPTLLPASSPPKYSLFDIFPFSMFVKLLTSRGKELEGKKAARYRARYGVVTHNVPLEISLYLSSYVSTLCARKTIDVSTTNLIINTINQLTDALTGLERILTTPIPFSYSIHLWLVTIIYCLALPFQIWNALGWVTIPGTAVASFIFFGFLVAGEEIENPFGYDKNDLNMDHFTHNIIRSELLAITSRPPPDPADWAFSPYNDNIFRSAHPDCAPDSMTTDKEKGMNTDEEHHKRDGLTPEDWVKKGSEAIKNAMVCYN